MLALAPQFAGELLEDVDDSCCLLHLGQLGRLDVIVMPWP
jgi:hypothetical protein